MRRAAPVAPGAGNIESQYRFIGHCLIGMIVALTVALHAGPIKAQGAKSWDGIWRGEWDGVNQTSVTIKNGRVVQYVYRDIPRPISKQSVSEHSLSFGSDFFTVVLTRLTPTTATAQFKDRVGHTSSATLTTTTTVAPSAATGIKTEHFFIPMADAGRRGLEALLVRPSAPGKYPLALISHGSPRKRSDERKMTPWNMYPMAVEFARRGWAAVIVMRRGYGESGGHDVERSHSCQNPSYVESASTSARDLSAAIDGLSRRPDIDTKRILAVGHSAGGLATVALVAGRPSGLVAAISFAGGRGSVRDFTICREDRLVAAFRTFGKKAQASMLWVYSENDHFFAPAVAEKFAKAFSEAGGHLEFIKAAPFGKDGHRLFSLAGTPIWTGYVDAFLAKQGLTLRKDLLPLPVPANITIPPQLSANGRKAFEYYLHSGLHKAFVAAPDGHFGYRTGRRTVKEAEDGALKFCRKYRSDCRILFVDDAAVP
jgi:dienelactone hydrolase